MPSVTACYLERSQGETTVDERNLGKYHLMYRVETDGVLSHKAVANGALTASPHALPSLWSTYSYQGSTDTAAYALNYKIDNIQDQLTQYAISVFYRPLEGGLTPAHSEPNPVNRPAIAYADREVFTRIIERDNSGKAIVNKCGRPYDTPYEEEDARGVLVVEFNVATLSEVFDYQRFLRRATNISTWTPRFWGRIPATGNFGFTQFNFAPRTVAARDVTAGYPITEGQYTYFPMMFRFSFAEGVNTPSWVGGKTWDVPFLERGYQYFKFVGGSFELDADGNKRLFPAEGEPEPVNLADNGTKLGDGLPGVFTDWRIKREVDFNLLPFTQQLGVE